MLAEASPQFWRKSFMFLIIPCQIPNLVSEPCSTRDLMDISHYFTWIGCFPAFCPQVCKLTKELVLLQLSDQWVITLITLTSVWFLLGNKASLVWVLPLQVSCPVAYGSQASPSHYQHVSYCWTPTPQSVPLLHCLSQVHPHPPDPSPHLVVSKSLPWWIGLDYCWVMVAKVYLSFESEPLGSSCNGNQCWMCLVSWLGHGMTGMSVLCGGRSSCKSKCIELRLCSACIFIVELRSWGFTVNVWTGLVLWMHSSCSIIRKYQQIHWMWVTYLLHATQLACVQVSTSDNEATNLGLSWLILMPA